MNIIVEDWTSVILFLLKHNIQTFYFNFKNQFKEQRINTLLHILLLVTYY